MEILTGGPSRNDGIAGIIYRLTQCSFLCVVLLCGLLILVPDGLLGQADEYEVKAAFLFNFTKFVEWPPAVPSPAFVIGILGDNPFGQKLDELTRGKTVQGRALEVRRLKDPAEARQCRLVFVRSSEWDKATKLVETVKGFPVLTVGETPEFARIGGMIYLTMEGNHVVVGINGSAAKRAQLKISAKLMSLAKLYDE